MKNIIRSESLVDEMKEHARAKRMILARNITIGENNL